MKFNPEATEVFETEGTKFEYNHERTAYLSEDILQNYDTRIEEMGNKYKSAKPDSNKKIKHAKNILALHSEWNVENNDETLYLVFNNEDEAFTDVTTENEYYANPIEES